MPSFVLRPKRSNPCAMRLPTISRFILHPLVSVKTPLTYG
jgi:hypothetical protein